MLWQYIKRKIEDEYGITPLYKHEHNWEIRSVAPTKVYGPSLIYLPTEQRDVVETYTIVVSRCSSCGELREQRLQGLHTLKGLQ